MSGVSCRRDNTLSRNVTIASAVLGCVCLAAAGVVLLGREHTTGSLPDYVASHKALKIAWAEPEQQAQFERNPMLAGNSSGPKAEPSGPQAEPDTKVASLFDDTFGQLSANAPAVPPSQVPLPHAKPRKLMVAKLPPPRERVVEAAPVAPAPEQAAAVEPPAPETPETVEVAQETKPEPPKASIERAMTLMSYAPATREQLFAPEVTGSIGNPLRDLVPEPTATPKAAIPLPAKLPHDKGAARIMPEPAIKLAKPRHKMTPQEKLWGPVQVASLGPLDAIGPDGQGLNIFGRDKNGIPRAPYDKQTAVYVITDKKVYMPDGSVLEAHSGLGDKKDDPRFVHMRMRGATPPHVYDLKMREALFHGVEAIRMTPIGGEEAIFGRDGILAHSYMLGPSGQSNGCVSFKDYDEFLTAFKDGKINRLAVIAWLD